MELNAIVTQRIEVAPGLIILQLKPEGWELPDFIPGQFAVLGLPGSSERVRYSDIEDEKPENEKMIKRAYSIASSSSEKEYVEFYVTLVRSGALTPRLFSLKVGDKLWMNSKFTGMFTLSDIKEEYKNVVLLSTGTGLAPYMSMVRTELECGKGRKFAVIHGARHSWDLGYRSELVTMERICPDFSYVPIISRPDDEPTAWQGLTGYVQDLLSGDNVKELFGFEPSPEDTHVFLCGNPGMIEKAMIKLEADGYREHTKKISGQLHVEKYW
ncbi:MAG: ferredoxin--NADP reductase [Deltaproteobacteria bacterium]|nr:ferredoxin--NADP reductase [Deltaproteobacteria bacterium]